MKIQTNEYYLKWPELIVDSEVQTPFPQRRRSHVGGGESDTNSERTVVVVQVPAESNGGTGGVLIKSNGHTSGKNIIQTLILMWTTLLFIRSVQEGALF